MGRVRESRYKTEKRNRNHAKILFVIDNYFPKIGGDAIVFSNLAEGLVRLGHDVMIVTHRLKGTKKFEMINGVKIHRVNCFHSRYWFTFISILKVLTLSKKTDIIHTTTYHGAFPARVGAIFNRKPCVITVHELVGKDWKNLKMCWLSAKLHRFLEKLIMKLRFDKFICVSKSTQIQTIQAGVAKDTTIVIYNGIDYDFFNPKKYEGDKIRKRFGLEKSFVCLFYGRPGITKGLEYLIKAVPLIIEKIPNSKLLAIVSRDKAYEKKYKYILRLIDKLGVKDKIVILDPVSRRELPNYIKAADCIVVPSLTEGFGFTAAESCAMEKPVVASNTTSLPEVVSGRYILVEPGNAKAIAEGVEKVYRGKVEEKDKKIFSWDKCVDEYLEVYQEAMYGKQG